MKNPVSHIFPAFLVVVLMAACTVHLSAREPVRRNAFFIGTGAAVPYSDFATSSFTWRSGFAKTGVNLDAGVIRYGRRGIFGLYAEAGYTHMFFNENKYLAEYNRILGTEGTTTVTTEGYRFLKGETGFLIRTVAILDTRFILKAGVGYTLCRHPRLSAANTYWGDVNTVNSDLDMQISGTAGIRAEHDIDERTGIFLSYQLFACKPDFRDTEGYRDYTFYLPVRYQQINLGVTRYF